MNVGVPDISKISHLRKTVPLKKMSFICFEKFENFENNAQNRREILCIISIIKLKRTV